MLVGSLSDNPGAYCRILDILYSKKVLIHETYKGMVIRTRQSSMEKANQVREFLSWLKAANTPKQYMEFYAALKEVGLQFELETLLSHEKCKDAEKSQVNTCTGTHTLIT